MLRSPNPPLSAVVSAVLLGVMLAASPGASPAGESAESSRAPDGDPAHAADAAALDAEIESLKREVLALNRDLFMLEEELLYPASTQVAVFVSMDVGTFFALDAVTVRINDREVAHHLYTEREADALLRGGVHRIWTGNLRAGEHELVAVFTGTGPHGREYRRGAELNFEKGVGTRYMELKISDRARRLQPEFIVREWE